MTTIAIEPGDFVRFRNSLVVHIVDRRNRTSGRWVTRCGKAPKTPEPADGTASNCVCPVCFLRGVPR